MRTSWLILCILWVLFSAALAAWVGFDNYLHPPNLSPLGTTWLVGFGSAMFIMGVLCPFWRGRLLLCTVLLALTAVIATGIVSSGLWLVFSILAWLIILAAMIGRRLMWLLQRLSGGENQPAEGFAPTLLEKSIFQLGLGFAGLIALTAVAGYAHLLYPKTLFMTLAALTAILIPENLRPVRRMLAELGRATQAAWCGDMRLGSFCFGAAALGFLCALAFSLAPAMQYDAVNYHLGIPLLYIRHHGIIPVPEEYRVFWIYNGEMLYTLAMGLAGQPLPELLHLTFAVLTAGLIFALGRAVSGPRAAWLGVLLFFSTPEITILSSWAFVEMFATFFTLAFITAFVHWWRTENRAWFALAGIFGGLALSSKINSLFVIGPAFVLAVAGVARSPRLRPAFFKNLLWFAAPLALMGSPWMIRNWIQTGNPVFPFMEGLFKSPIYDYWDHHQFYDNYSTVYLLQPKYGKWAYLVSFLRLPFDYVWQTGCFGEDTYNGAAGCIPLLAVPWAWPFFTRERRPLIRLLAIFAAAYVLCWFFMASHIRYLMPIFPVLVILGALTLDAVWLRLAKRLESFSLHYALVIFLFFIGIPYLLAMRCVDSETHWEDPQRYPLGLWSGRQTAEQYLDQHYYSAAAFKYIDAQPGGEHKVLAVGMPFRLYTTARVYGSNRRYINATVGPELFKTLASEKFDFLLLDKTRRETGNWDPGLVSDYVPQRHAKNNFYVFDLKESNRNLAQNPSFEQLTPAGIPVKFSRFGTPLVDASGKNAHTGQVAVCVDVENGFFEPVAVEGGGQYGLRIWARAERPGGKMRLQVNWHDAVGKYLGTKIALVTPTAEWAPYRIDVQAPPNARQANLYVNSHQKGFEVWMDDLMFARK